MTAGLTPVIWEGRDGWGAAMCRYGQYNLMEWCRMEMSTSEEADSSFPSRYSVQGTVVVYGFQPDADRLDALGQRFLEQQFIAGNFDFGWDD